MKSSITEGEILAIETQHLPYEVAMLQGAAEVLAEGAPTEDDHRAMTAYYMAIESFYMHLRNLHAFFFESRAKPSLGDVVASQLLDGDQAWRKRAGVTESRRLTAAVDQADALVAHLGRRRIDILASGRGLNWHILLKELQAAYRAFQEARTRHQKTQIRPAQLTVREGLEYGEATTVSTPASATVAYGSWLEAMIRPSEDPKAE